MKPAVARTMCAATMQGDGGKPATKAKRRRARKVDYRDGHDGSGKSNYEEETTMATIITAVGHPIVRENQFNLSKERLTVTQDWGVLSMLACIYQHRDYAFDLPF